MNPSPRYSVRCALDSAKTVFVLPNNKNIIMAAEQRQSEADRNVVVLATRTIPQGLAAKLVFDHDADATENILRCRRRLNV